MLGFLILAAADACALLTAKEIEAAARAAAAIEALVAIRGELNVRQCFYQLPTFEKSVSLEVTSGPGAKAYWRKAFHEKRLEEEEGEEEKERPERVTGVGKEAFWTGSARLGGLYVLKKDSILRLSIGGAESKDAKLAKLRALARSALKRL